MTIALFFLVLSLLFAFLYAQKDGEKLISSKLLEAAVKTDVEGLRAAVKAGESIDVQNTNGFSAAMFGVVNHNMAFVRAAIELGINLNMIDNDGYSPLMRAAAAGDKQMVEVLLEGNASPLEKTSRGETAYSLAVDSGRTLVSLLLADAAVIHGIEMSNVEVQLEYLRKGAFIDIRNSGGYTPLISAASVGDLDGVKAMIAMRANANNVENDGWSPLHFAAVRGNADMVKELLNANAHPAIAAVDGRTPKMVAKENGFDDIVKLFPETEEIAV